MDEGARPATSDDLERLTALAHLAIVEQEAQRGGVVWSKTVARRAPLDDGFRRELTDSEALVLVGTIDGYVVGYTAGRLQHLDDGGTLAVLSDLYVEPEARAIGIGEAMMDEAVAWAQTHGCIGIDAVVLPGNRESKNFFETFGLVARAIVVHRALEPS